MIDNIQNIKNEAIARVSNASDIKELERLRIDYLGRKGKVNELFSKISKADVETKKKYGILINDVKKVIEDIISETNLKLSKSISSVEWFDFSYPGKKIRIGHLHPQTLVLRDLLNIFRYLGYQVADGPEIETDYYNFGSLNMPKNHPSRDTQMTFYLNLEKDDNNLLLRTQTSAMQGRIMETLKPPYKIIVPGRCFRYDQVDASHGFEFWQIEGFIVDKGISLTNLFGTLEFVLKRIFGDEAKIKFATTNFPFVEPGVDAYLGCTLCNQKGCSFCKNTGWSEIMPAGMIHPNVLKSAGVDPKVWGGFAFAIGLSRVVNLKYRINDLRTLTTPDIRIINQFK